jgi:glycosyltransferase involved in cell wall biosynthesis
MLQGDDIYLESLPERYRSEAKRLITEHCREMDGFIATSSYYADFMAEYLSIPRPHRGRAARAQPRRPRWPRTPRNDRPLTVGYFARICPEKGLHVLVEAFRILRQTLACRLRVGGWLGDSNKAYFEDLKKKLHAWDLADDFEHLDAPGHADKVRFLHGIDVLSVPTTYREPKGLYVLEALANGIPVVQPRHGSFPELIEATGGGLLVNAEDPADLARSLRTLLEDEARREELGRRGKEAVHRRFNAAQMADDTLAVYEKYVSIPAPLAPASGARVG